MESSMVFQSRYESGILFINYMLSSGLPNPYICLIFQFHKASGYLKTASCFNFDIYSRRNSRRN